MMRVLFFLAKTSWKQRSFQTFPLGTLSIASYLESKGHVVKIIDRSYVKISPEQIIKEFAPDLVGVTVMSAVVYKDAVLVSKIAKKNHLPVAWGGFMASALYDCVLKEDCVDYVIRGEGEETFEELIHTLTEKGNIEKINGLAYKKDKKIILNPPRKFADLGGFPPINWNLIDVERYLIPHIECEKMAFIYTSKGCPGRCTFCYNKNYHNCQQRRRPIEHVISEMEYLIETYGVDGFYFSDELFYYPEKEMAKFYTWRDKRSDLNFVWGIQCRVNTYTKEDFQKMYQYGCRWAFFGIEAGTVERIKRIKKGINFTQVKNSLQACKDIGIATDESFIIGFPDEDEDELKETIQSIKKFGCENPSMNIYFPQPESEDYNELIRTGRYKKPTSFKKYSKVNLGNDLMVNFSKIPDIDLKVVHYWSLWHSMMKASSKERINQDKNSGIVKEYVEASASRLRRYGVIEFIMFIGMGVKQYIKSFWYSHAYPSIIRKYHLNEF